MLYQWYALSNQ